MAAAAGWRLAGEGIAPERDERRRTATPTSTGTETGCPLSNGGKRRARAEPLQTDWAPTHETRGVPSWGVSASSRNNSASCRAVEWTQTDLCRRLQSLQTPPPSGGIGTCERIAVRSTSVSAAQLRRAGAAGVRKLYRRASCSRAGALGPGTATHPRHCRPPL